MTDHQITTFQQEDGAHSVSWTDDGWTSSSSMPDLDLEARDALIAELLERDDYSVEHTS